VNISKAFFLASSIFLAAFSSSLSIAEILTCKVCTLFYFSILNLLAYEWLVKGPIDPLSIELLWVIVDFITESS
jgi:hypothetical protein